MTKFTLAILAIALGSCGPSTTNHPETNKDTTAGSKGKGVELSNAHERGLYSRASTTPGLQKNGDGSVDIYFGAKAPAGKESNWVPTDPKRGFELLARFYGPEKGFFEKGWKMGDVEEVK